MSVEVCPAVSAPGVYASGNSTHQTTWNIHWISSQKRYPKKRHPMDIPQISHLLFAVLICIPYPNNVLLGYPVAVFYDYKTNSCSWDIQKQLKISLGYLCINWHYHSSGHTMAILSCQPGFIPCLTGPLRHCLSLKDMGAPRAQYYVNSAYIWNIDSISMV